ncbi:MAG: reverse transcriptase domain-containing protein, partial [Sedimenticola sp.]
MFVKTTIQQRSHKLLLDTGSPYSVLSYGVFEKSHTPTGSLKECHIPLKAADGSDIPTRGQLLLNIELDGKLFQQNFIVAKLEGLAGIIGMDFLEQHDAQLYLSKKLMKTNRGNIQLYKEQSNACAHIRIAKTLNIPPSSEMFIEGVVDLPCMYKHQSELTMFEPTNLLRSKGCLVSRTLVDTEEDKVVIAVVNLSEQCIKVSQNSLLGRLQDASPVCTQMNNSIEKETTLPDHLQVLLAGISQSTTEHERNKISQLLTEYQDIFTSPDGVLGQTGIAEHSIETLSTKPIKIPPRRLPIFKRETVNEELDKMLQNNIIEPSSSPWSAPICLVKKKDGTCRFCIDFRGLNQVTTKDAYPLPRIDDTLDSLAGSRWYSTLDLASGYWQIKMEANSKDKTAFATPHRGLFHFNVMPFGLTNAPATFERLMDNVLYGLTPEQCLCYLDDIIIVGVDFDTALKNLAAVFHRLREANLTLKPKKCCLFQKEVTFLGHLVSESGISCNPSKVDAIKDWPCPNSKTEVRTFLGLAGYYRKFIPHFSEIAKPLTAITKKNERFRWNESCTGAFQTLKESLGEAPVLGFPEREGMFILDTDASANGIGAVLSQIQTDGERVLAYASRTLNPAQQQYCTTKRELLAVVTFLRHFKQYLLGRRFKIRTDHAPLVWLRNFKEPEGLYARWISIIETFDYEIQYRPGTQHGNADALSRKPNRKCPNSSCLDCVPFANTRSLDAEESVDKKSTAEVDATCTVTPALSLVSSSPDEPGSEDKGALGDLIALASIISPVYLDSEADQTVDENSNWLPAWSTDELREMQKNDPSIDFIRQCKTLSNQKPPREEIDDTDPTVRNLWFQWESLEMKNDLLYRKWLDGQGNTVFQLLIAEPMRQIIFDNLHSSRTAGHFGRDRTLESIRRRFYWPDMSPSIARWVKSCDTCAKAKLGPGLGKSPLRSFKVTSLMDCVAIDIFGPLPTTEDGNEYIIVLSEYFSKWVEAWATPNHTAITVADKVVSEFFVRFGCPRQIHTDQGR